jgi:hypothetical protein
MKLRAGGGLSPVGVALEDRWGLCYIFKVRAEILPAQTVRKTPRSAVFLHSLDA